MDILLCNSNFTGFMFPYSFDNRRSPPRFDTILADYFRYVGWVANKLIDKTVSYEDHRELLSLLQGFKDHFYEILDDKEFMNDVKGDYIKLLKICFHAFEAEPNARHHCLK
jgi:hypothetical protein